MTGEGVVTGKYGGKLAAWAYRMYDRRPSRLVDEQVVVLRSWHLWSRGQRNLGLCVLVFRK